MNILETKQAKGCKHQLLQCLDCGSIISLKKKHKVNKKELLRLAEKVKKILEKEKNETPKIQKI